jgi:hypothetical protein
MNNRKILAEYRLSSSKGLTAFTLTPFKGDTMIKGNIAEFRLSILAGFIALVLTFSACSDGLGDESNFEKPKPAAKASISAASFSFSDVEYWVGSGPDSAIIN